MRWYERLYVGEKAKKKRYATIQAVRGAKRTGYYVLTPAANGRDLFDLIPAVSFAQEFYQQSETLIVGIAADFADAAALSGRIIEEMYQKTGGFDVQEFLKREKE